MTEQTQTSPVVSIAIVAGLLAILAALLLPVVTHVPQQSHETSCRKNLQSLFQAAHVYASKYGGATRSFPGNGNDVLTGKDFWRQLCAPGTNVLNIQDRDYSCAIFQCPARETFGNTVRYRGPDTWSRLAVDDPIGCDDEPHGDSDDVGGPVLLRDGSVKRMSGNEWRENFNRCRE